MTVVRLVTQFDDPRRRVLAVATPTCCSCCCCCCAITLATSATLTAVHLHDTAAVRTPDRRWMVTAAGAVSVPAVVGILIGLSQVFELEAGIAVGALVVAAWLAGLTYLYRLAGHPKPWAPPAVIAAATAAGMAAEFYMALAVLPAGLYAEVLAIPVAIVAGIYLHRALKARSA